jgi:hypothetical protein
MLRTDPDRFEQDQIGSRRLDAIHKAFESGAIGISGALARAFMAGQDYERETWAQSKKDAR